jgi:hypothetical protein
LDADDTRGPDGLDLVRTRVQREKGKINQVETRRIGLSLRKRSQLAKDENTETSGQGKTKGEKKREGRLSSEEGLD